MIEQLREYYEYVVLIILILVFVFNIYVITHLRRIRRFFSSQRFRITSVYEIEPYSLTENFSITIFNNNINDSRLVALGFVYKNKNIDYYKSYLNQNELGFDAQVVIPSRDSISLKVSCDEIKKIIRDLNGGKKRTKKLVVFAIDSLGITTFNKAGAIRKNLVRLIKLEIKYEKKTKKLEQDKIKKEKKEKRQEARDIRRSLRKEKWDTLVLKLKSRFNK